MIVVVPTSTAFETIFLLTATSTWHVSFTSPEVGAVEQFPHVASMKLSGALAAGGLLQATFGSTGAGPWWPGPAGLRYLFAFGDSYTAIEFNSWKPIPTDESPIGVPYPGVTWIDGPNYFGYTITQYNQSRLLGYDYAVGGNTVQGVRKQIMEDFLSTRGAGHKPSYAPWTASDSLFACFVGINDLNTHAPINPSISELFDLHETLYHTGARNFLFINVPPIDRAPFGTEPTLGSRVIEWNARLKRAADAFRAKRPDTSVFYYDTW
ncbi:unnamed protein product [Rhizoctonia solani]|uniref:Uncharacterized protein n=1 Tax=Rhizoctonia solani TaxID=456999 RepID=A0A8H3DFW5_9AGAM|nr:unnamed protein product [Rhizoctonia solani]